MRSKKQAILSWLIAAAMVLSMIPLTALAREIKINVLINILYEEFYSAELGERKSVKVDSAAYAAKTKLRTGTLMSDSYHVNRDRSNISLPVKVKSLFMPATLVCVQAILTNDNVCRARNLQQRVFPSDTENLFAREYNFQPNSGTMATHPKDVSTCSPYGYECEYLLMPVLSNGRRPGHIERNDLYDIIAQQCLHKGAGHDLSLAGHVSPSPYGSAHSAHLLQRRSVRITSAQGDRS